MWASQDASGRPVPSTSANSCGGLTTRVRDGYDKDRNAPTSRERGCPSSSCLKRALGFEAYAAAAANTSSAPALDARVGTQHCNDLPSGGKCSAVATAVARLRPSCLVRCSLFSPLRGLSINRPERPSPVPHRDFSQQSIRVLVEREQLCRRELCDSITAAMYHLTPLRFGLNTGMDPRGIYSNPSEALRLLIGRGEVR